MPKQNPIIWTPFQRQAVIDFLKHYISELEKTKDNPQKDYGLEGIQAGILHLADKVLPSGTSYIVNRGPDKPIRKGIQVIFTDEEYRKLEEGRSGNKED